VPGEVAALLAAALWAVSTVILTAQTRKLGAVPINALRSVFAALFVILAILLTGAVDEIRDMTAATAIAMVGSGILAMGVGDSLYFGSLARIGALLAVPISISVYPLLTFLIAAFWLDEEITWSVLLGTALIVAGVSLLVRGRSTYGEGDLLKTRAELAADSRRWQRGLILILAASVAWAISTTWLKAGSGDLGAVAAGGIRVTANAVALTPVAYYVRKRILLDGYGWRGLAATATAGILGIGIGSLLYVFSVQEAGAGKTAILTSTMPLFSLPLAVLFLSEKINLVVILGTLICILGIWLVA
jgi:drug/metabolite transporter (DMT)-like permease